MRDGDHQTLSEALDELERTDPEVAEARRLLDELPEEFARHERHMAARRAVGKRKVQP
ncbi:MAG: hypothetical protein ABFE07_00535 [Armatimonadia bacterium]